MKSSVLRNMIVLAALAIVACARKEPAAAPPAGPVPEPAAPAAARPLLKLGVILPQSGPAYLRPYSEAILDGIRLAASEQEAAGTHRVELLVRDDSGRTNTAARVLRALADDGVVAVIGPLTDAAAAGAARVRTTAEANLVVMAPLATKPLSLPATYALNVEDTAGASALGRYAASRGRAGVLHARSAGATAEARAFARAVTAAGGAAPVLVPFDSGTTNFATHIRRLRDARAVQVYVGADSRQIRQIIPQLGYYGLASAQVFGGEAWASDELRRALPAAQLEGVIVTTVLPRSSDEVRWRAFEQAYGTRYKRAPTSPIPALGYDAAKLIFEAAGRGRPDRADIARSLGRGGWHSGATGVIRLTAGAATRRPFLMRIRAGALEPVTSGGS